MKNAATLPPERSCDHGTPIGTDCGRCAALELIEDTDEARWLDVNGAFGLYVAGRDDDETDQHQEGRLFATAAELGVPPVAPGDADLSRIRATYPESLEEYERLHAEMELARAERKARYDRINGAIDLARLLEGAL